MSLVTYSLRKPGRLASRLLLRTQAETAQDRGRRLAQAESDPRSCNPISTHPDVTSFGAEGKPPLGERTTHLGRHPRLLLQIAAGTCRGRGVSADEGRGESYDGGELEYGSAPRINIARPRRPTGPCPVRREAILEQKLHLEIELKALMQDRSDPWGSLDKCSLWNRHGTQSISRANSLLSGPLHPFRGLCGRNAEG